MCLILSREEKAFLVMRLFDYTFGMDSNYKKKTGTWGETVALEYLTGQGYQLVQRNYHSRYGEADLIMRDETGLLTCVEVKTRRSQRFGPGENSIGKRKLQAITQTMTCFLYDHTDFPDYWNLDIVVVEDFHGGKAPEILHIRSIQIND